MLPSELIDYLNSARRCSNPSCEGVYFTHRVQYVDFVDFCGKFRVPLLKYLCSPHPAPPAAAAAAAAEGPADKMKMVLLSNYHEDFADFQ